MALPAPSTQFAKVIDARSDAADTDMDGNTETIAAAAIIMASPLFNLSFNFFNLLTSISFFCIKKSLRYAGLVNWYFCCASQKKDSHRLLIVFSAGIRLVTERGRVWEGGNGKKGYPQKGINAPRRKTLFTTVPCPCHVPVSGTSPMPLQSYLPSVSQASPVRNIC